MSYDLPSSWAEVYARLSRALASETEAYEWVGQALESRWGVTDPAALPRNVRAVALQKCIGALYAVEEADPLFTVGARAIVQGCFARFFGGEILPGPPWRTDPYEPLPSEAEWRSEMEIFL